MDDFEDLDAAILIFFQINIAVSDRAGGDTNQCLLRPLLEPVDCRTVDK